MDKTKSSLADQGLLTMHFFKYLHLKAFRSKSSKQNQQDLSK
jgi:hypothetical protein